MSSLLQVHDSLVRHFSGSAAFRSRSLETQIGDLNMDASGVHFGELRRSIARVRLYNHYAKFVTAG